MVDGLVQNYSQALFNIAEKRDRIDVIKTDLELLFDIFKRFPAFLASLQNPSVDLINKRKRIDLLKPYLQKETIQFLALVTLHHRTNVLVEILKDFLALYKKEHKIHVVQVTAAAPLSKANEAKLISLAKQMTHAKKVEVAPTIDPTILGGCILHIEGRCLDASLRSHLQQLLKLWRSS